MPFDISDRVKKDDLLMQLDEVDEQVLVDQADATLAQAKSHAIEARQAEAQGELDLQAAIEKADADLSSAQIKSTNLNNKADRQHQLLAQKLASQEDYETAQSDAAQAQSDLDARPNRQGRDQEPAGGPRDQKRRHQTGPGSGGCTRHHHPDQTPFSSSITPPSPHPMDGIVSDIPTTIGLGTIIASAISNVSGGTTVLTLSDLSQIYVMSTVDESDIGGVDVGQPVKITVDAYHGKVFDGKGRSHRHHRRHRQQRRHVSGENRNHQRQ